MAGARVNEAHRAQGAEPHGIGSPGGHDLNGHTALVDRDRIGLFAVGIRVRPGGLLRPGIKIVERCPLGRGKGCMERLILRLVERAVEVIGLAPVIAGSGKHFFVIETFRRHDGGHGVVKMQPLVPRQLADLVGQGTVRQGTGSHQDGRTLVDPLHPLPVDGDVGAGFHQPRHLGAERVTVHSQRAAGGHTGRLGGIEELAAHPAHLLLEQAGSGIQPLGLEAVGADELGKPLALVGRGKVGGFLLIELHLHALARQPERRLAARKAGTQYSNLIFHSFSFSILALSVIAS